VLLAVFALGASVAGNRHAMIVGEKGFLASPGRSNAMHFRTGSFGSPALSGQTRLMGVATSVNGSNFTVGGHGSSTNVTTNNSTQYHNSNLVKQNDTVGVIGIMNGNTLTATNIIINP
jgi:hypothetical protein